VKVEYRLARSRACVGHEPPASVEPFGPGNVCGYREHFAQHAGVGAIQISGGVRDVSFWNNEDVGGRRRVQISKSDDTVCFGNNIGRDAACGDAAEDAVPVHVGRFLGGIR